MNEGIGSNSSAKFSEQEITAAKRGDWEARNRIINGMTPLITSLAEKRTGSKEETAQLVEAGKKGVRRAINKYKPAIGPDRFQVYVVDFIEKAMNRTGKKAGILSRLFGS